MKFIVIDTETGGLDSERNALLSIGAVYGEIGEKAPLGYAIYEEFAVNILPARGTTVGGIALGVQGSDWGDLDPDPMEKRIEEADALTRLGQWITIGSGRGVPIFAHNAEFDRGFMSAAIRRSAPGNASLYPLLGRDARWNCTRYMAESLIAFGCMDLPKGGTLPDGKIIKPGVSLDALILHFDMEGRSGGGHGALEDARLGAQVLYKLSRLAGWI